MRPAAATPTGRESPAGRALPSVAACEEHLADMWRRRTAVEHALRVASELYAEAEASAMQAYAQAQQRAGGGGTTPPQAWWKERGAPRTQPLTAAQREEVRAARAVNAPSSRARAPDECERAPQAAAARLKLAT